MTILDEAAVSTSFVTSVLSSSVIGHVSMFGVAVGEVGQVPANGIFRIRARYNRQLNRSERKQTDSDHGNDPRVLISPSLLLGHDRRRRRRPSADGLSRSTQTHRAHRCL